MINLGLLTVNVLLVSVFRSEKKYWFISIPLWTLLVLSFIFWRQQSDAKIKAIESAYWKSAGNRVSGDDKLYSDLKAAENLLAEQNRTFLHLILFQSFLTFALQLLGYWRTSAKATYKWTGLVFGIIFSLNLFLELLLSVGPTGGIVG